MEPEDAAEPLSLQTRSDTGVRYTVESKSCGDKLKRRRSSIDTGCMDSDFANLQPILSIHLIRVTRPPGSSAAKKALKTVETVEADLRNV